MAITTKLELEQVQSSAPAPVYSLLSEDQVDDLIYFARNGQVEEFQESLITIAESSSSSPLSTIAVAFDPESGNSPLHMASANGHIGNNRSATPLPPTGPRYSICCGMKALPNQSFGINNRHFKLSSFACSRPLHSPKLMLCHSEPTKPIGKYSPSLGRT